MTSWFNEGYEAVEQRSKELEEQQNRSFIPNFILKEDEEAKIIFLTDKPINFYEHYVKSLNRYFTCSQKDCPLCDTGNKPSYRGAYLILDTRYEEWTDRENKKQSRQNTVKVMKQGIKALKVIKKHEEKRGLKKFAWEIERTGSGTDTTYTLLPEDLEEVTNGIKMPTEEEIAEAKKLMLESLAPKDRNTILDILAGRNPQNNGGGNASPQNQQPNVSGFSTDLDEENDPEILRFM